MAKKNRKPNLPQETLARARREMYNEPSPVVEQNNAARQPGAPVASPVRKPGLRPVGAPREVDLRKEYAYVVHDLQTIGMLAAVLMIVLVVMSFFI